MARPAGPPRRGSSFRGGRPPRRGKGPRGLPPRRPRPSRAGRRLLIGAGLALLLWWLWPASPPPPVEEAPVAEATVSDPSGAETKPKVAPRKPVQPVARVEQKNPEVDAAALREAIAKRSKDLEACNASNAPERLHAKLLMTRKGTVKSVGLSHAGQVPAEVASCVRDRVRAWTFTELALSSEVEVMVTFSLTPGLAGATGG